jgi:hypothetical protein
MKLSKMILTPIEDFIILLVTVVVFHFVYDIKDEIQTNVVFSNEFGDGIQQMPSLQTILGTRIHGRD